MTTSFRPLTAKQRAELKSYVAWGTTAFGIVLCVVLIFVIASAFHFLHSRLVKVFPGISHALWWIVPTAIVVLFIGRVLMRGMQSRAFRAQVRSDLARDELVVHRIDAVEAIEVEEQEDEGQTFFIMTTDGETMFFSGQYLDSYTRRGFPWKSFEILEAPSSKILFGLKKIGDALSPSFVRQPFTWEEAEQLRCYSCEYATIKDDFESLKIKASAEQKISEAI